MICAWMSCVNTPLTIANANIHCTVLRRPGSDPFQPVNEAQAVPYLKVGAKTPSSCPYASYLLRVVIDILLQLTAP